MKPAKNALEWVVFGFSVVLLIAVVLVLVIAALQAGDEPPVLQIDVGTATRRGDVFRLPVRVRNSGAETAEDVHVEVVLNSEGSEIDRGELTLAFVPRNSTREGWVTFRQDPRCCTIAARAVGYNKP